MSNTTFLVHHFPKNICKTLTSKTLHYNSSTNRKFIQITQIFTSPPFKYYPHFSYINRINSKTQIRLRPNSYKIAHVPIKNYYNLLFSTTPENQFFPTVPHRYFSTQCRTTLDFFELFTDDKTDTCANNHTKLYRSICQFVTLPTEDVLST